MGTDHHMFPCAGSNGLRVNSVNSEFTPVKFKLIFLGNLGIEHLQIKRQVWGGKCAFSYDIL